jgi:toxin ParE1/3/4
MKHRIHPQAETDIRSVMDYIALDSPKAARKWHATIKEKCRHLGETPGMGISRPEFQTGIRTFSVGSYLIVYRSMSGNVDILRVLHGARQWQDLL